MAPSNNALEPSPDDVCRVLHDGLETWETFLRQAEKYEPGSWPNDRLNPYVALNDVPALPADLPRKHVLTGRTCWRLYTADLPPKDDESELSDPDALADDCSPDISYGPEISIYLRVQAPVTCHISESTMSSLVDTKHRVTDSLAVLTLCWAYIFSARLVESQRYRIRYTSHRIYPTTPTGPIEDHGATRPDVKLNDASPALVRWLCAILSPTLGWECEDQRHPPWSACLSEKRPVTVAVGSSARIAGNDEEAPNSRQAIELLIELYGILGLSTDTPISADMQNRLKPLDAAFLAALMIPAYRSMGCQVVFPPPRLQSQNTFNISSGDKQRIRQYLDDSPYFMTLTLSIPCLGSVLWGIFWQPDVPCNVVGSWFAAILRTLRSTIKAKDAETLVKVFLTRRPKCGIWWYALLMLGDRSVLDWIPRYLSKVEEKFGYGSMSPPNPTVSIWTGAKQSFMDSGTSRSYQGTANEVSREDWLRCRFNFKLQDSACIPVAWKPFGTVDKSEIELELWPWLEGIHQREYVHFTWYTRRRGGERIQSLGFRRDTGRNITAVPDNLMIQRPSATCRGGCRRGLRHHPSRAVTRRLMGLLVGNACYERNWGNAVLPGELQDYSWMEEWRGLEGSDVPVRESSVKPEDEKRRLGIETWLESLSLQSRPE